MLWLCSLLALAWALLTARAHAAPRRIRWIWSSSSPRPQRTHAVTVIVPARDEERAIRTTIESLLRQRDVELEVIAVNDGSADRTGQILDELAGADPRLRVLHHPPLREGWTGKANAVAHAARLARHPWLVFTDADITFAPDALATAAASMEREDVDLLTLLPRFEWHSLFEHAVLPGLFLGLSLVRPRRLEDPQSADAVGVGAFIMVRRAAYEAAGGHAPVASAVMDDFALALHLKRSGSRVRLAFAPQLTGIRMYEGNAAALRGFEKNVLVLLGRRWYLAPLLPIALWLVFGTGPLCVALGLLGHDVGLAAAGAFLYAIQYLSLLPLRSWNAFSPAKLLAFPLIAVTITSCAATAFTRRLLRGTVRWRGRELRVAAPDETGGAVIPLAAVELEPAAAPVEPGTRAKRA